MKNCCRTTKKDKQCVRKSDEKKFTLPRKFSKQKCKKGIKGFTMRSSCAPYKDCLTMRKTFKGGQWSKGGKQGKGVKQGKKDKQLTYNKNMLNKSLEVCSTKPMTGFYRSGKCMTGEDDRGTHTVCAKMDKSFLDYTADKGNDLSSVVKPGQNWCLCEYRWQEAFDEGKAPKVKMEATNMRTDPKIRENIRHHSNRYKRKSFLFNPTNPKKSFDVYIDKDPSDTIPIKYTTLDDVKQTIKKLEKLYKAGKYPHKRISQVAMILEVRLRYLQDKKKQHHTLAKRYYEFLKKRTKVKGEPARKKLVFS